MIVRIVWLHSISVLEIEIRKNLKQENKEKQETKFLKVVDPLAGAHGTEWPLKPPQPTKVFFIVI